MRRRPDGALERDVLRVLWASDRPLSPAEINAQLDAGYAYTSIATIVTRLYRKGLVERIAAGRAYAYSVTLDEAELAVRRIGELLDSSSDRAHVLSRFIGSLTTREINAIRGLLGELPLRKQEHE